MTYVRFGDKVYSPIIDEGECDFLVSFEKLEAARYVSFMKKGGVIVTNTQEIDPMPVITGQAEYPSDILEKVKELDVKVDQLDCLSIANSAGSSKAVNIVLMGRLSNYFSDIEVEEWEKAIRTSVPEKFLELNLKAFSMGRKGE